MPKVVNLKKKKKSFLGKKEMIVIIFAIVLTTVGIKASDKLFNSNDPEGGNGCPSGMVFITSSTGGFCIDVYEAAASKDCTHADPKNQNETRDNIDDPDCTPVSEKEMIPWRNISQNQAAIACSRSGKRLPTNEEWLQASLGTPDISRGWSNSDCHVNKNWNRTPGLTGSGEKCISSFGAYDMIGNVWEWVDGTIDEGAYDGVELPEQGFVKSVNSQAFPNETDIKNPDENYNEDYLWIKKSGTRGIMRGGYWDNKSEAGLYSMFLVSPPSAIGEGVGFRCVK